MPKAGMKRPNGKEHGEPTSGSKKHGKKNNEPHVEELQGKAKSTKEKAKPILYD